MEKMSGGNGPFRILDVPVVKVLIFELPFGKFTIYLSGRILSLITRPYPLLPLRFMPFRGSCVLFIPHFWIVEQAIRSAATASGSVPEPPPAWLISNPTDLLSLSPVAMKRGAKRVAFASDFAAVRLSSSLMLAASWARVWRSATDCSIYSLSGTVRFALCRFIAVLDGFLVRVPRSGNWTDGMWRLGITGHVCREECRFKKKRSKKKEENFGERDVVRNWVGKEWEIRRRREKCKFTKLNLS